MNTSDIQACNSDQCEELEFVPSPRMRRDISRGITVQSSISITTAMETPCDSVLSMKGSKRKPYKFRPRYADEGLEDFQSSSETDGDDEMVSLPDLEDSEAVEKYVSEDLAECCKVAAEMETDIMKRYPNGAMFASTDLFRE
jgi:hypothetical protein